MTLVHEHTIETLVIGAARWRIRLIRLAFADGQLGGIHAGDGDVAVRHACFDEAVFGRLFLVVDGFFRIQIGAELLKGGVGFGGFFQGGFEEFVHFFLRGDFPTGIAFLIGEGAAHMQPGPIVRAKKLHAELAYELLHVKDVIRNVARMTYLGWPPSVQSEFRPHDVAEFASFSDGTILAEPFLRWYFLHAEALDMIRRGTGLATQ